MVFFGLDIGTTNTKAVLLGRDGELLNHTTILPNSQAAGKSDSALTWYELFCKALDHFASKIRFVRENIVCSITAQGNTFVLVNDKFDPVSRIYSWTEDAGTGIVKDLISSLDSLWYYHTTGWEQRGWLAACKLKEIISQNKLPKEFRFFSAVPDFVYARITGKLVTDITNAQITGLCDFENSRWNREILAWAGLENQHLPPITTNLKVLFDEASSKWGKITFVTGSHDQYAAMEAAGLKMDKSAMLATGTAWVINLRTARPLFDDNHFLIHPGRDLHRECFGNIITMKQIGRGFDKLLNRLGVSKKQLAGIESGFEADDLPKEPVKADIQQGSVDTEPDADTAIRRYMEWAAASVAFMLDRFGLSKNIDRLIMSGGAVASRFWPQLIADLCNITVEAVDFPEFTAYGAALHAQAALTGKTGQSGFLKKVYNSQFYEPLNADAYRQWYHKHQQPALAESLLTK